MNRRTLLKAISISWLLPLSSLGKTPDDEVKVLFPVTFRDRKRWKKVFLRIRSAINLWGVRAEIEVVAYDEGIFLLDRFESGEFEERISNLMIYGIEFKACQVAMNVFGVEREALYEGVEVVKSGFEYHILKVKEGYIPIYL